MTEAVMPTYARVDLAFERGEGPYLYTADGRRFLDFGSGIGVTALGHAHPHLVEAIKGQAEKLWHCSNLYRIPEGERLARRLCEASFADKVFFCNSGAEAVEGSIKLVRKYHYENGHPERTRMITCSGAFHGRTVTTLSAAANPKYLTGFGPGTEGFDQVAFGNMNELRNAITPETAGILVEPVQGEGGIRAADLQYLRDLRTVADEFGLLLVFDEVQCGMGRSGKLFVHEWAEISPDVMALAKGLGSGFPVGAILASDKAAAGMTPGSHGSTFGGNPLAMSVCNAVLDVILEPGFLAHVEEVGEALREALQGMIERHPRVYAGLRGRGLILGLECRVPNGEIVAAAVEGGLLTVAAAENVVRLLPSLVIEKPQVEEAVAILERVAAARAEAA